MPRQLYDEVYEDYNEIVGSELLLNNIMLDKMTTEDFWRHLKSAALTFGSTFLITVSFAVLDDKFAFSRASLLALGVAATIAGTRGVAKLLLEWFGFNKI